MMHIEANNFPMDTLRTPRLILRKVTMRDAEDMYRYSRDPEVARHVLWDAHQSLSETRAYLRFIIRKYRMGEPASWGIEHAQDGRLIGTIGYMWYQAEHRSTEVGYSLSRDYWNRGLMTEALQAVVDYTFIHLNVNRLEAQHELANPASGVVMRKVGMNMEGVMRERLYNKGRYVDVAVYAMVRSDYMSRTNARDPLSED